MTIKFSFLKPIFRCTQMIIRSRWRLFRSSLWQTIGTGFLLGVLLVIANLLLIGTWNTQEIRDWVQPKLGMYFYVTQ